MARRLTLCFLYVLVILKNIGNISPATLNKTANKDGELAETNCEIVSEFPEVSKHIAGLLSSEDNKLVKITLSVAEDKEPIQMEYPRTHYRPDILVLVTSETGKSMLLLKEYFESLSLQTLGYGVKLVNMSLTVRPINCIKNNTLETMLRSYILSGFNGTISLPATTEVCNGHIGGENNYLFYECCKNTLRKGMQCSEIHQSNWLKLLLVTITVLQVLVILFCPLLVPESMYQLSHVFADYVLNANKNNYFQLNVKLIRDIASEDLSRLVKSKLHRFVHFRKFKEYLRTLQPGATYTLHIKRIEFSVLEDSIIPEGHSPVSFPNFIKTFFMQCQLRNDIESVRECCDADMCVSLPCKRFIPIPWYCCLERIMLLAAAAVLAVPWLIRVWYFYTYEQEVLTYQKNMLGRINLSLTYSGSLLTYLTPTHYIFIAIYVLLPLEVIVYSFLTESSKRKLKFTVRKCFRDMRNTSTFDACAFCALFMLSPLKRCGLLGCFLLPVWVLVLPFCLLSWAIKALPIVNLSLRLLLNFFVYIVKVVKPSIMVDNYEPFSISIKYIKNIRCTCFSSIRKAVIENRYESNTRGNKILHAVANVLIFITIWAVLLLVIECVHFYVECAVYTLIGFIVNPNNTLKYVSLILLIGVYGFDCFKGVRQRYSDYSKEINTELQSLIGDRLKQEAFKSENMQENTGFMLTSNDVQDDRHMELVNGSEGYLKWRARRLVLFLGKTDIPKISIDFLYAMAQLPHQHCPGPVYKLYLKAFIEFALILLFLAFVFIVIFAFGQANDISTAGQTLAALGSGFLPLVFRKAFEQSQATSSNKDLKWQTLFYNKVNEYASRVIISDMIPINEKEISKGASTNPEYGEASEHVDVSIDETEPLSVRNISEYVDSETISKFKSSDAEKVGLFVCWKDNDVVDIYVSKDLSNSHEEGYSDRYSEIYSETIF